MTDKEAPDGILVSQFKELPVLFYMGHESCPCACCLLLIQHDRHTEKSGVYLEEIKAQTSKPQITAQSFCKVSVEKYHLMCGGKLTFSI